MDVDILPKKLKVAKYTGNLLKTLVMFTEDCIETNPQ